MGIPLEEVLPAFDDRLRATSDARVQKTVAVGEGRGRRYLEAKAAPLTVRSATGRVVTLDDLTQHRRAVDVLTGQKYVLERIASGAPLGEILEEIVRLIEAHARTAFGCVMLLDAPAGRLNVAAAPSLPDSFRRLLDGVLVGMHEGSCAAAVLLKAQVISKDIAQDPLWAGKEAGLREHPGLRTCWSTPIVGADGQVLGTIALYFLESREPEPRDRELIDLAARLAQIAIELRQVERALSTSEGRERALVGSLPDLLLRVSLDGRILDCRAPRGFRLLLPPEVVPGKSVSDALGVNGRFKERIEEVARDGKPQQFDFSLPDGSVHYEARLVASGAEELLVIIRDVTDRKRAEDALRYKSALESVVMEISARFIHLAPEAMDEGIAGSLARIGEFIGAEHSYVFLLEPPSEPSAQSRRGWGPDDMHEDPTAGRLLTCAYEWASGGEPLRWPHRMTRPLGKFPWLDERLERLEPIFVPRSADLPAAAKAERERCRELGVEAVIWVPLARRDGFLGFLGFDSPRAQESWTADTIRLINVLGEILVHALERRKAEDALRESEDRYRALEESSYDVIVEVTADGRYSYVSPNATRVLGYAREELLRQNVFELIHPEDEASVASKIGATFQQLGSARGTYRVRRKDGEWRWLESSGRAYVTRKGEVRGLALIRDVTERKKAQQEQRELESALRRSANEWRLTFDAVDSPILILDGQGSIMRLNRAARDLLGRRYGDLLGQSLETVAFGEPWQSAVELERRVRTGRAGYAAHVKDPTSDRSWEMSATRFRLAEEDEEREILIARDVTETARLEESLRRSEMFSAMGALVAGVAHEVRNPLFGISACLDAFQARFRNEHGQEPFFAMLRADVERLSQLMKDLLEYGRPASTERRQGKLSEVVDEALAHCLQLAREAGVALVHRSQGAMPGIAMDRQRLAQVFQNLMENGIQHSRPGTEVSVETDTVEQGGRAFIRCRVLDSGPGFRPEDLPQIFEPFYTRRRGGSGLGLSIVQRVVAEHDGTITAANRPKGGAVMEVRFPCAAERGSLLASNVTE